MQLQTQYTIPIKKKTFIHQVVSVVKLSVTWINNVFGLLVASQSVLTKIGIGSKIYHNLSKIFVFFLIFPWIFLWLTLLRRITSISVQDKYAFESHATFLERILYLASFRL